MSEEGQSGTDFTIVGTVIESRIKNLSKLTNVRKLYNIITIRIDETVPASVADQLFTTEVQDRRRVTSEDDRFEVGDRVTADLFLEGSISEPSQYYLTGLKRLENTMHTTPNC